MTVPLFGEGAATDLEVAPGEEWAARQFRGVNMRIGRNRTVHRVAFLVDERGVELPAPECHVGSFAGGRPWWKVYATSAEEVDCGSCLSGHRAHGEPGAPAPVPGQLAFDLGVEPLMR